MTPPVPTLRLLAAPASELSVTPHDANHTPWWLRLPHELGRATSHLGQLSPDHASPLPLHYLTLAGVTAAAVAALVIAYRILRMLLRRRAASAAPTFRVALPETFDRQGLVGFFRTISALLRPHLIGVPGWVVFTVSADGQQLEIELCCSRAVSLQAVAALEAAIPGVNIERLPARTEADNGSGRSTRSARCVLVAVGSRFLPFQATHRLDPAGQVLAAMQGQTAGEGSTVQLTFSAPERRTASIARKTAWALRGGRHGGAWRGLGRFGAELADEMLDLVTPGSSTRRSASTVNVPSDPWRLEQARAVQQKTGEPLLACSIRLAAWARERRWARARLAGLVASFAQYHELAGLGKGSELFSGWRATRRLPALKPPLILTAAEAAALLPLPAQIAAAPVVLPEAPARRLAPAAEAPREGVLIGRGERAGFHGEIRIAPSSLPEHVHVLGPTGRGKTTVLCNLYLEAARLGLGGAYIEPKGDAVADILARIPEGRVDDTVLLDFGDELFPPALNLLVCAPGDEDVHVEALVGIFRRLFGRFWGPRSEDIFRSALATLLSNRDPTRPAPTLADVLALLSDPAEKARHPIASDPVALGQFWRHWRALSESQREQALAPLSNKLRAFLGRRALRNVLCQQDAPDFEQIISQGKLLLVSLPARTLGDAADLIGSVIVYRLWQAAQRLGPDPRRRPFVCLVDEAHRFCRLPQGLAQALAEARGYRLGFVLAHQHLAQLTDPDLLEAVDANCQTKICFALPPRDAHRMAGHFAPRLEESDLQRLGRFRIACRISHQGRQLPAATAATLPLPEPAEGEPGAWIEAAARGRRLGRLEVELEIARRYGRPDADGGGGRAAPDAGPPSGPRSGPPLEGGPRWPTNSLEGGDPGGSENPDNHGMNDEKEGKGGWRDAA